MNEPWKPDDMANRPGGLTLKKMSVNAREVGLDYEPDQVIEALNNLYMAAKNVINWTERAYRPPVLDEFETGRMVKVRLHALADLQDAIESIKAKNT